MTDKNMVIMGNNIKSLLFTTKKVMSFNQFITQIISTVFRQDPLLRWRFLFVIIMIGLTIMFDIIAPLLLKNIIQEFTESKNFKSILILLALAYGFTWGTGQISMQLREIISCRLIERIVRTLTRNLFHHINHLPMSYYYSQETGKIINAIHNAQEGFPYLFSAIFFYFVPTLLEIIIICIVLYFVLPIKFVFIFLAMLLAYSTFSIWALRKATQLQSESYDKSAEAQSYLVDCIINFETIKIFGKQATETKNLDKHLKEAEIAKARSSIFSESVRLGQVFILGISLVFLTLLGVFTFFQNNIGIESFILVNAYFMQLTSPLNYFSAILKDIKDGFISLKKAYEIYIQPPERTVQDNKDTAEINEGIVEIRNVDFSYYKNQPVLKNISFYLKPGNVVALVGETGSGKTTIAKLLFRFFDPTFGSIFIDGHDISSFSLNDLRQFIGYVSQDSVLFNNTILYNITYGYPEASDTEIKAAIKKASLEAVIKKLPQGYNTIIGERGVNLSGGERQRIVLARMFLVKRKVYIFDEVSSALDNETQKLIQETINSLAKDASVLLISHRLSTLVNCDEILVLSNGIIIERGKHEYLLLQGGKYSSLWRTTPSKSENLQQLSLKVG